MIILTTNNNGDMTTSKYTLRSAIIARYLTATAKELTEKLNAEIEALVDGAIPDKTIGRHDAVTIDKATKEKLMNEIDGFIEREKQPKGEREPHRATSAFCEMKYDD